MRPRDEAAIFALLPRLCAAPMRSVAIGLMHACANPAHERRAGEILRAQGVTAPVCRVTSAGGLAAMAPARRFPMRQAAGKAGAAAVAAPDRPPVVPPRHDRHPEADPA